jgi:septum site-determining protein MinD
MRTINVVSGKGGTGKTLITAVLAELLSKRLGVKVLVIDMDIFVRGLTCLLYFQADKRVRLLDQDKTSVADIISGRIKTTRPGISRYRTFDVWPAVSRVDEKLPYRDLMPDTFEEARQRVGHLIEAIPSEYDLVFLDSRAGYDELIAATHSLASFSLNVEEDDLVSRITSDNLVSELEMISVTAVYRIVNKSLGKHRERVGDLGRIPFDADIMRTYGEESFWVDITRSLLEPALVDIWNNVCVNERMEFTLKSIRSSPIPSNTLEKSLGRINLYQRVFAVYGFIIGVAGLFLTIGGRYFALQLIDDPIRLLGIVSLAVGGTMAFLAFANVIFRK